MSDTPRVASILAGAVGPLARASSRDEFTAALRDALQRLIAEAKKLERENVKQAKQLEDAFILATERSRRGRIDRELYAVLGISMDGVDGTSNVPARRTPGVRPLCSECADAARRSFCQEIRHGLKARGLWAPERESDLLMAVFKVIDANDSLTVGGTPYRAGIGSALDSEGKA